MTRPMDRRGFVRLTGSAALGAFVAGCGEGGNAGDTGTVAAGSEGASGVGSLSAEAARAAGWARYDDSIVIDALAGPIQFNIPQEGLPLRPEAVAAVSESGITDQKLVKADPAMSTVP